MRAKLLQKARHLTDQRGVTLIELVITMAIASLVVAGLNGIVSASLESRRATSERNDLIREARFAMDQLMRTVRYSPDLFLPLADNPATNWREHVREQTVPPSPPEGTSTNATAVLAVALPAYSDLDFNGIPDADNDADGRIDEDADSDRHNDFAPGIYLIDDDGDGQVDDGGGFNMWDDDEQGGPNEDSINIADDDADGTVDEDPSSDMNGDGCPGICGVDDDGDGNTDEGGFFGWIDDDEDGAFNEDWFDAVVFYLDNGTLKQRLPVPWDESGSGGITGLDFLISDLADNVTQLRFERLATGARYTLVEISIELTGASGQSVDLTSRVRVGGAL